MSIMKAFNVEIFTPSFQYRGSGQTEDIEYKFDYMDVDSNTVVLECNAYAGDYLVADNGTIRIYGVITSVKATTNGYQYGFKSLNSIFDVDIFAIYNYSEMVEETLERLITETYITNDDELQNIEGLEVLTLTSTEADYGLNFESGKVNLFNIILEAFTTYGIVCDFSIDKGEGSILLTIEKVDGGLFNIEPELPNILEKEIVIKQTKQSVNKVVIYNTENIEDVAIYYKDANDEVTDTPDTRVTPVIFTTKGVKVSRNQTFEERALKEAGSTLKATKYENLMTFTTANYDLLLRPLYRCIGQQAKVYIDGTEYTTILTGYNYKEEEATLIFGTIRLELTKKLKRSWRSE